MEKTNSAAAASIRARAGELKAKVAAVESEPYATRMMKVPALVMSALHLLCDLVEEVGPKDAETVEAQAVELGGQSNG